MLIILYGAASELGRKCRDYLQNKGYELVDKYSYAEEKPIFESRFGQRVYLSEDEFYTKTDSLFRYSVTNFQVGFNWEQISDAVYDDKKKLLTCAAANVDMLRKIKEVYHDKVHIIYCYVDASALEGLFVNLPGMTAEEFGGRMAMGMSVKECYSQNADLFDSVVIYGGEGSVFNYETLYKQFDAIVGEPEKQPEEDNTRYDIFLSFCLSGIQERERNNQYNFIKELIFALRYHGIRVIASDQLQQDNYNELERNMLRSSVFIPVFSQDAVNNPFFQHELQIAINAAKNNGLVIKPISLDRHDDSPFLKQYAAYSVSSDNYLGSINFIEDWFIDMFSGEKTLKKIAEQVEMCIHSSLYEKAFHLQGDYVSVLRNHLSRWHRKGTVETINADIKYLRLAIKTEHYDSGSYIINDILSCMTDGLDVAFDGIILRAVADYCESSGTDAAVIIDKAERYLTVSPEKKEQFLASFREQYSARRDPEAIDPMPVISDDLADKIAAYSNASVELFEALFRKGITSGYREALIAAYHRVFDYCRSIGLGNEIAEKCIDRVAELKSDTSVQTDETEIGKKTLQSLKVYLGQALPDTGKYDVFISHKSADDALADKVYDYLKTCGYEVFCDHHTLGELRDSEYDKRVTAALQNAKHLILLTTNPEYVKDQWVYYEWHQFFNDKRLNRRNGNLLVILSDGLMSRIAELPAELRDGIEIIKTSEFRDRLNNYLW